MVRAVICCAVSSHAQHQPDKISLPQQEADARAVADVNGWDIVGLMMVPEHSRRYITLISMCWQIMPQKKV